MFEYMYYKLPIVASNFKLFCDIFDKTNCGLNVDPYSPKEIAEAIDKLLSMDLNKLKQNAKKAALANSWENQEKKMITIYQKFLN